MNLATAAEMRAIDARTTDEYGIPSLLLMENAGAAVARRALAMVDGGRVAVYCGKGNNGGDGLVVARHLASAGCDVRVYFGQEPDAMRGDAAVNLGIVRRIGLPLHSLSAPPRQPWAADLVVDAVLGTGLKGEVAGPAAVLIETIRRSAAPVLAIDLPSGLDSDTGRLALISVRARWTVTLALPKIGLALYPGREAAGRVEVADIGIPRALLDDPALQAVWTGPAAVAALLPPRPPTAHKGDAGRVFVLAGSEGMIGAAALSSMGAVRGGAGLVTLGVPRSLIDVAAAKVTEVMTFPVPETDTRAPDRDALPALREKIQSANALAVGPGLGQHSRTGELLRALLSGWVRPVVVDADALNLLSPAGPRTFPRNAVLTPHPGELARLMNAAIAEIEADRVAAVRRAADRFRCVVLLKGAATLVADPAGRLVVNSTGTPAMATGGCGDVLTGLIAALLAQRLSPFDAAAAGAYLHGLAGELAASQVGGPGIAAGDLLTHLPAARRAACDGSATVPWV